MKKFFLLCLMTVLTIAGVSACFANEVKMPAPGVYHRNNDRGAVNGLLYIFKTPEGKLYFEARGYDYNPDTKALLPAYDVKGTPKSVYAGLIEPVDGKIIAHLDCVSDTDEVVPVLDAREAAKKDKTDIKGWTFPLIADTVNGKPVRLDYQLTVKDDMINLFPSKDKYSASCVGKTDVAGRYYKDALIPHKAGPTLAAYVSEQIDPNLSRRALTKLDVSEWWVDRLEAGSHEGFGTHPAFVWVKAYDGIHDLIGTYLIAEDLSCAYKDGVKVF